MLDQEFVVQASSRSLGEGGLVYFVFAYGEVWECGEKETKLEIYLIAFWTFRMSSIFSFSSKLQKRTQTCHDDFYICKCICKYSHVLCVYRVCTCEQAAFGMFSCILKCVQKDILDFVSALCIDFNVSLFESIASCLFCLVHWFIIICLSLPPGSNIQQKLAKREVGTIDRSQDITRLQEFYKRYREKNNVDKLREEEMLLRESGVFSGRLGEYVYYTRKKRYYSFNWAMHLFIFYSASSASLKVCFPGAMVLMSVLSQIHNNTTNFRNWCNQNNHVMTIKVKVLDSVVWKFECIKHSDLGVLLCVIPASRILQYLFFFKK